MNTKLEEFQIEKKSIRKKTKHSRISLISCELTRGLENLLKIYPFKNFRIKIV